MSVETLIIVALVAAHLAGDFLLQPDGWARHKARFWVLVAHAALHAALSYVLLGAWGEWRIPVAIFVAHGLIDFIKVKGGRHGIATFLLDQGAHVVSIVVIATLVPVHRMELSWQQAWGTTYLQVLVIGAGLIAAVHFSGVVVAKVVQPFLKQLDSERGDASAASRGFESGGRTIGYLERALIFVLIIVGEPAAIGFLFAAKSILRFGEIKEREHRMEAEYIIIGTMLSFLLGIVAGLVCRHVLRSI